MLQTARGHSGLRSLAEPGAATRCDKGLTVSPDMAEVIFYEKPGCITNARQKALLRASGHTLEVRDLLGHPWQIDELAVFFAGCEPTECFNPSAPAVKTGKVVPEALTMEQALALMIADPLLIRRPLLQVGEQRRAGFDATHIAAWIGLNDARAQRQDLVSCAQNDESQTPRCGER